MVGRGQGSSQFVSLKLKHTRPLAYPLWVRFIHYSLEDSTPALHSVVPVTTKQIPLLTAALLTSLANQSQLSALDWGCQEGRDSNELTPSITVSPRKDWPCVEGGV